MTQVAQMRQIESLRPHTSDQLHRFVEVMLSLRVPRRAVVEGHSAPFDYLDYSFFEDQNDLCAGDIVVWANRGGGKTYLGAVATLLDLLFKPGVQVRILGGSLEQSSKMYLYLKQLIERPVLRGLIYGKPTQRRVALVNGSVAEMLSQSQRSVRGQRVHKMRCDEVEEFNPEVWQAAQLVTRSGMCGDVFVRGTVEALSTMHRPFGLMNDLVKRAGSEAGGKIRMFQWCALDVVERCPPQRDCGACVLWSDCQGMAKEAQGFVSVDDLVAQWHRSSREAWASEMMCQRPRRSDSVYPNFDQEYDQKHVVACLSSPGEVDSTQAQVANLHDDEKGVNADRRQVIIDRIKEGAGTLIGGMDFGLRSPLVMLWAWVRPAQPGKRLGHAHGAGDEWIVEVFDEYVGYGKTLEQNLEAVERRGWPKPSWVGVDPAGGQRNSHTGLTDIQVLRDWGYKIRSGRSRIRDGIERIRRRLDFGTLRFDPRSKQMIEAMVLYHFDPHRPDRDEPVKDGPDHLCDALRYMLINLERGGGAVKTRSYL